MTTTQGNEDFREAFSKIAEAAAQARELRGHSNQEREVPANAWECSSAQDEVRIVVQDGEVRTLATNQEWLQTAAPATVEETIRATVNEALKAWQAEEMRRLEEMSPAMTQLTNLLAEASVKTDRAFQQRLKTAQEM